MKIFNKSLIAGLLLTLVLYVAYAIDVRLSWEDPNEKEVTGGYILYVERFVLRDDRILYGSLLYPQYYLPSSSNTFTISNLTSGHYKFTILTTNKFGRSLPAEISGFPSNVTSKTTIMFEIK